MNYVKKLHIAAMICLISFALPAMAENPAEKSPSEKFANAFIAGDVKTVLLFATDPFEVMDDAYFTDHDPLSTDDALKFRKGFTSFLEDLFAFIKEGTVGEPYWDFSESDMLLILNFPRSPYVTQIQCTFSIKGKKVSLLSLYAIRTAGAGPMPGPYDDEGL